MNNTRFAVAVHILTLLYLGDGQSVTSEVLAGSVNTHPSLIRRLLSQLNRAGLTRSAMGAGGGALLARSAQAITLLDVRRALDEQGNVYRLHPDPNPACLVGRHIASVLENRLQAAESAFEDELAHTTIANLAGDIDQQERRRATARTRS